MLGVIHTPCTNYLVADNTIITADVVFGLCIQRQYICRRSRANSFTTGGGAGINPGTAMVTTQTHDFGVANAKNLALYTAAGNQLFMTVDGTNTASLQSPDGSGGFRFIWSFATEASSGNLFVGPGMLMGNNSNNKIQMSGASAGTSPLFQAAGSDTDIAVRLLGKGARGGVIGAAQRSGAPSAGDIPSGCAGVVLDSGDGKAKLYYNNAGSMLLIASSP